MDDFMRRNGRSVAPTEIDPNELHKNKVSVVGAGLLIGVMAVLLHPISVVKTRLQVASNDAMARTTVSVIKGLLKNGGIPGLYKGFGTATTGTTKAKTLFLFATKVAASKMVQPLGLSVTTQAAIANQRFNSLWFQRMVAVPLHLRYGVSTDRGEGLFYHKISGLLPVCDLTETFKTWLAPVPLSPHFRNYWKKSRANGRKATSKPKSLRKKARHGHISCFHCSMTFDSPAANADHYKLYHKDILSKKPLFDCKICGNFFNEEGDFKNHGCPFPPGLTSKQKDGILKKERKEKKKEDEQMKKQKGAKKKKK